MLMNSDCFKPCKFFRYDLSERSYLTGPISEGCNLFTGLYRISIECKRYRCHEAEKGSCFAAFVPPSIT